jgi:hypothetical protein
LAYDVITFGRISLMIFFNENTYINIEGKIIVHNSILCSNYPVAYRYVAGDEDTNLTDSISNNLEPICRQLLYALHNKRYALLKST